MIKKRINKLRSKFVKYGIDGYVVPKNDEFFSEYAGIDRLKFISNFSGSAGYAIILKNKNYLFVDGRYTLQAKKQSGKKFKILEIPYVWPKNLSNIQNFKIGFNPRLFTHEILKKYFENKCNLIPVEFNFKNKKKKKVNKLFFLNNLAVGENSLSKITRFRKKI